MRFIIEKLFNLVAKARMLGLFNNLTAVSNNLSDSILDEENSDMKLELSRIIKAVIEVIATNLASTSSIGKSKSGSSLRAMLADPKSSKQRPATHLEESRGSNMSARKAEQS